MPADPYYTNPAFARRCDASNDRRIALFQKLSGEKIEQLLKQKALAEMAEFDSLPREWRELVWDHGLAKVRFWIAKGKRPFDVVVANLDLSDLL